MDIKANGSDGLITLNQSDTLTVTVALNNNGITDNADWWLAVDTPRLAFIFTHLKAGQLIGNQHIRAHYFT